MISLFRLLVITCLVIFILPAHVLTGNEIEPAAVDSTDAFPDSITAMPDTIASIAAPMGIRAMDSPNDAGQGITVSWQPPDDPQGLIAGYEIFRSENPGDGFSLDGFVDKSKLEFRSMTHDGVAYYFRVRAKTAEDRFSPFSEVSEGHSKPQIFHTGRMNALVAVIVYIFLLIFFVTTARRGKSLFIRRIAGLDALDEAVGRATEMGKPILYVPGLSTMSDVATIAAINILGPVAKKAAEYESNIMVPNADPIVMTVARQVVKESFLEAGRPDGFNEDMVFFITTSQFGYTAAVDGIMMREKPATNLFIGMFWAESLVLAETGNMTGAIQIAGTDAVAQLPFFVAACDYTIIGEELYAASAYLSKQPVLLGSLKAQDFGKALLLFIVAICFVIAIINTGFAIFTKSPNAVLSRIIAFFQFLFNV
jgi:hypothetical protein